MYKGYYCFVRRYSSPVCTVRRAIFQPDMTNIAN
jgi:hypothetical protein